MRAVDKRSPFRLDDSLNLTPSRSLNKALNKLLEKGVGLDYLDCLYQKLPEIKDQKRFLETVLDTFNIRYQANGGPIPNDGPLIVVANHPFGAIEGVILADILKQVRDDIKVMANFMLKRIPELSELFISVNPYGHKSARTQNLGPMKKAIRWVKEGGVLVVFPAGDVSRWDARSKQAVDQSWSETIGSLVRLTGATVLPVYFHGTNSRVFHRLGNIHPRVRTALLPRELINKANAIIPVCVGEPIESKKILAQGDNRRVIDCIRFHTYALRERLGEDNKWSYANTGTRSPLLEICPATPKADLLFDIEQLPADRCLAQGGRLKVYIASADEVPSIMREIGRLREITFREAGEGTGNETDIDRYDRYYKHLFVWNAESREVVGAYRLGLADEIKRAYGKKGLYTQSLFKYRGKLLKAINPAIELGRSFVRLEYQRSFSPLMLLWKGIGVFVAQNPRYSVLFGPVSISNAYRSASQQLMVEFLKHNTSDRELSRYVRPRTPFKGEQGAVGMMGSGQWDLEGISGLVALIEPDNKGLPILLKQYLKLGGKILGFNVDMAFNSLDGLVMVDLRRADRRVLSKYMGHAAADRFIAYHDQHDLCA